MNFNINFIDSVCVVELMGDILGENVSEEILAQVSPMIGQGTNNVVLELSQVRYLNSSALGLMITIFTKVKNKGGVAVLVNPSPQVNKILELTKLDGVFQTYSNLDSAIKSLA